MADMAPVMTSDNIDFQEHTTGNGVTLLNAELCWLLPVTARELVDLLCRLRAVGQKLYATGTTPGPMPEVELMLTRDDHMAMCNLEYMGLPGPTNILSFPSAETGGNTAMPASLILSVDTLHREAFLYGQPTGEHLLRLLAHGFGHAAGYDHSVEMDVFCANLLNGLEKK